MKCTRNFFRGLWYYFSFIFNLLKCLLAEFPMHYNCKRCVSASACKTKLKLNREVIFNQVIAGFEPWAFSTKARRLSHLSIYSLVPKMDLYHLNIGKHFIAKTCSAVVTIRPKKLFSKTSLMLVGFFGCYNISFCH